VLALRLLSELHHEFNQPLHVAYIDIKAVFDSVDRVALWKALRSTGAPPFLIQLIADLHQGTTSHVRVGGRLSQPFRTSGVRQGCILAPALFCVAMDWIMSRCANTMGISVGSSTFTELDYADDAVLLTNCQSKWPEILSHFDTAAQTLGLHTSWQKTKVQNVGYGPAPSPVNVQGQSVEVTDQFTYLASAISSSGRSASEIYRRIGLASSIMGQLANILRQEKLCLSTKLRLYNAFVVSVLLHGAETWILLKTGEQKLEAFNMSCQRRILGIRWYDFATSATIIKRTGQESVCDKIARRRRAMFGHVRRLPEVTLAHMALHLAVKERTDHRPDNRPQWKRPRGRPRHPWMQQLESTQDSLLMPHGTQPVIE